MKYLAFRVDGNIFAIEVSKVMGVLQTGFITPLPCVDPSILGVIKQNGWIWCVMDLGSRLHTGTARRGDPLLAVAVEYERQHVCIVTDEIVSSLINIEAEDFRAISAGSRQAHSACITACAIVENTTVYLLSLEHLFHTAKPPRSAECAEFSRVAL